MGFIERWVLRTAVRKTFFGRPKNLKKSFAYSYTLSQLSKKR